MTATLRRYPGNSPTNVAKDASYSIVRGREGWEVRLVYRVDSREKWLLTTTEHDALSEMVNAVKAALNRAPGGRFYLNEFGDVLVPDGAGGPCLWAGKYVKLMEFEFGATKLSPELPAGIEPGDVWPGPHAGIRYKIKAGGGDVEYTHREGNRSVERRLSDYVPPTAARGLAQRLAAIKGPSGGRIYINERCHFFAPMQEPNPSDFIYLGSLEDDDVWFPAPEGFDG